MWARSGVWYDFHPVRPQMTNQHTLKLAPKENHWKTLTIAVGPVGPSAVGARRTRTMCPQICATICLCLGSDASEMTDCEHVAHILLKITIFVTFRSGAAMCPFGDSANKRDAYWWLHLESAGVFPLHARRRISYARTPHSNIIETLRLPRHASLLHEECVVIAVRWPICEPEKNVNFTNCYTQNVCWDGRHSLGTLVQYTASM